MSFLEDLIVEVAKEEPSDPVEFCITWLQSHHERKRPLVEVESS